MVTELKDQKVRKSLLTETQVPIQYGIFDWLEWVWRWLLQWLFRWVRLDFTIQPQQQTQWCWAAVAVSTSLYYDPSSSWTQCSLASAELGQTTCCQNGASAQCNRPWYLDRALSRTGNLANWASGSVALNTIRSQIDSNRLLGVRIGWSGGGGHFVLLEGYRANTNFIAVEDPWYGASDVDYTTFTTNHKGSGSWTHTYYTQP
jgi:hypothetical protein